MQNIKSFVEFQKELTTNTDLQKEFKDDPVKAIQQFQPTLPDNWVYRMVVGSLGLSILLVIVGIIILAFSGKPIEPIVITLFTAIASGAVGALAGLLAPSPKSN
jgi:uncharacterized membrane protein